MGCAGGGRGRGWRNASDSARQAQSTAGTRSTAPLAASQADEHRGGGGAKGGQRGSEGARGGQRQDGAGLRSWEEREREGCGGRWTV